MVVQHQPRRLVELLGVPRLLRRRALPPPEPVVGLHTDEDGLLDRLLAEARPERRPKRKPHETKLDGAKTDHEKRRVARGATATARRGPGAAPALGRRG